MDPNGSPDCAPVRADAGKFTVEVGEIFVRDEARRRHELAVE